MVADSLLRGISISWFSGLRTLQRLHRSPHKDSDIPELWGLPVQEDFVQGVNLPWLSYGNDFGSSAWHPDGGTARPEQRQRLHTLFQELKRQGFTSLRWFMLCDGRSGIRWDAQGMPVGLDDHVFADIDAALEVARAHDLGVIFVLFDFHWFGTTDLVRGVQLRGRLDAVANRRKRRALFHRVIVPILTRYGRTPSIWAWDIVNEPEWATCALGGHNPAVSLMPWQMRRFLKHVTKLVHRHTNQMATVGLASAHGLPLVRGIGLDFYQIHWYDRVEETAPLDRHVRVFQSDRSLILGEFPTRGSARSHEEIVVTARKNGYRGAFAWSAQGGDEQSGLLDK
jgi:hypothetical protein